MAAQTMSSLQRSMASTPITHGPTPDVSARGSGARIPIQKAAKQSPSAGSAMLLQDEKMAAQSMFSLQHSMDSTPTTHGSTPDVSARGSGFFLSSFLFGGEAPLNYVHEAAKQQVTRAGMECYIKSQHSPQDQPDDHPGMKPLPHTEATQPTKMLNAIKYWIRKGLGIMIMAMLVWNFLTLPINSESTGIPMHRIETAGSTLRHQLTTTPCIPGGTILIPRQSTRTETSNASTCENSNQNPPREERTTTVQSSSLLAISQGSIFSESIGTTLIDISFGPLKVINQPNRNAHNEQHIRRKLDNVNVTVLP